ncbi:MAG: hypothetical protein GY873_03195 [Bosea sp.]|uniref:hypothetical protein n=1 Tax=Bosea sp. (in: a-proteobacteria) TaxID=1871050 RepID=UPI002389AD5E|nr:hypothetical protein [Bosea sp. (in: a-proteobacteria)]MCP4733176.1 hypothetical protein [Bosea sp. (in: a-proteobacteria)]
MVRSPRRLPSSGALALLSTLSTTLLLPLALPAAAQEKAVALDRPRLAQAPEPLCFCWSDGKKIAEGSMACIRTTLGRRLATCGRVTNLMSWEVTENPCPES